MLVRNFSSVLHTTHQQPISHHRQTDPNNLTNTTTCIFFPGFWKYKEGKIQPLQLEGLVSQILSVKVSNSTTVTFELALEKARNIKQDTRNLSPFNWTLNSRRSMSAVDRSVRNLSSYLRSDCILRYLRRRVRSTVTSAKSQKKVVFSLHRLCPEVFTSMSAAVSLKYITAHFPLFKEAGKGTPSTRQS